MEYNKGNEIGNEYEAQFFGFTPKSFVDGGKGGKTQDVTRTPCCVLHSCFVSAKLDTLETLLFFILAGSCLLTLLLLSW